MGVYRLATASEQSFPHVTPVCHAFDGSVFFIASDYGAKKLKNIAENPQVCLVVDEYSDRWGHNQGVMVQGVAEILEAGEEYRRALQLLFRKFPGYRANPWREAEAPIIKVRPTTVVSWKLNR